MPMTAYRCPADSPSAGEIHPFDHCTLDCQWQCLPPAVLHAIRLEEGTNPHKGDMISPSALGGCPRKLVWSRVKDYAEEPVKRYAAIRGSIIHGFLERPWSDDVLVESRFFHTIRTGPEAPYVLSGQIDGYDKRTRTLFDYKTIAEKGTYTLYRTGAKPEHVLQTNVYRYLLRYGHLGAVDGPTLDLFTERIVIHYILMNRVISTGTEFNEKFVQHDEPNRGKPYPLEIERDLVGHTKARCPIWHVRFRIPDVPIMHDNAVLRHIEKTAPEMVRGFRNPSYVPHGVETGEEWQCDWCPVQKACMDYENGLREKAAMEPLPFGGDEQYV